MCHACTGRAFIRPSVVSSPQEMRLCAPDSHFQLARELRTPLGLATHSLDPALVTTRASRRSAILLDHDG